MNRVWSFAFILSLVVLAGCGAGDAAGQAAGYDSQTPPESSTPAPAAAAPVATLNLGNSPEHGAHLVDSQGLAVYRFLKDTKDVSACVDAECLASWPVLTPQGAPTAGPGIDATLLNALTRPDGAAQVTCGQWPLYHFAGDTAPGQTTGQGIGGNWYLVGADCSTIGAPGAPAPAAPAPAAPAPAAPAPAAGGSGYGSAGGAAQAAPVVATGATFTVATSPIYGNYLATGDGRAVYRFDADECAVSNCNGDCAANWPPVIPSGELSAGEGVNAAFLGTFTRQDGTTQAMYKDWPVYTFAGDFEPGQTNGQGLMGKWHLVNPVDGGKILTPPPAA